MTNEKSSNQIDKFVAERIRYYRQRAGLTLNQLALLLDNISFQQLQKYETGANRVSSSRLFLIAQILIVPVSNFFPQVKLEERATLSVSEEADLQKLVQNSVYSKNIYKLILSLTQVEDIDKQQDMINLCQSMVDRFLEHTN